MKSKSIHVLFAALFLAGLASVSAHGQGKPPGGPPPGAPPAGAPGSGPGGTGPNGPSVPGSQSQHRSADAPHSSLGFGPVGRWWDDKSVIHSIGISKTQQQKMDAIFDANKPAILASYKTFLSEQSKLEMLNKNPGVDKAQLFAAIDAVNQARASLQKATSQMLLQIRAEMDPNQVNKLESLK